MTDYIRARSGRQNAIIVLSSGPILVTVENQDRMMTDRPISQAECDFIWKSLDAMSLEPISP